jgi:hypothetical protein
MNRFLKWEQLILMQQLNCICDTLAKIHYNSTKPRLSQQADFPPPQGRCGPVYMGHKITGNISSPLRFHASKEIARYYLATHKKGQVVIQTV